MTATTRTYNLLDTSGFPNSGTFHGGAWPTGDYIDYYVPLYTIESEINASFVTFEDGAGPGYDIDDQGLGGAGLEVLVMSAGDFTFDVTLTSSLGIYPYGDGSYLNGQYNWTGTSPTVENISETYASGTAHRIDHLVVPSNVHAYWLFRFDSSPYLRDSDNARITGSGSIHQNSSWPATMNLKSTVVVTRHNP